MKKILNPNWIWNADALPKRNAFARFRRTFEITKGEALKLRISADSRYWLYVNGEYVSNGPVRSWPQYWKYDEYDVTALLRPGTNTIAVLVNHYGEGNFQYIPAAAGLWVQLSSSDTKEVWLETDAQWKTSAATAWRSQVPRISVQEAFEEQYDARQDDRWIQTAFDDSDWKSAVTVSSPHASLEPSRIPDLTREPVFPKRILRAEAIHPCSVTWTLNVKPYINQDVSSNVVFIKGYLFTQVWSDAPQTIKLCRPHHHFNLFKVNGRTIPAVTSTPFEIRTIELRSGWNRVLFPYFSLEKGSDGTKPPSFTHFPQFVLTASAINPLRWSATSQKGGTPWAFVGPFSFTENEMKGATTQMDYPRVVLPESLGKEATATAYDSIFETGGLEKDLTTRSYFQEMRGTDICTEDVAASAFGDQVVRPHWVHNPEALLSDNGDWTTVERAASGDVRLLIDFGREILGNHVFELDAEEGVIFDVLNFEFIQPDGLENTSEGMNNSFRYICRTGRQTYRTLQRRGFQYSWLIFRNLRKPIRLRTVHAEFNSYPQARRGSFNSSDALLNQIWEVGAHTLRCCAEDTYTDCPSYEQTHWVGDARNESLIDWVINGDPRLWYRCLEQTAQSLERSPLTLSQVPSAWDNILPAWSFLWMRSCREYLLWTGDYAGATKLLPWVKRNVNGIEKHINSNGLFEIQGWNMFDWAEMDTPAQGIITHLNCFAVLALNECAELADWMKDKKCAGHFRALAASLKTAINQHLWNPREKAYIDSIHVDRTRSNVFSQQTQTVALISRVASGSRAQRCRSLIHHPPKNFVKAGSPFFEFFLLEVLVEEKKAKEFLDVIRRDWGFMIERGATTFWELWSLKTGRLTRSHCHGWSAAPTFFLSSEVLGIKPTKPGFAEVSFNPQLGDLSFLNGVMPTPLGPIEVQCCRKGKRLEKKLRLPAGIRLEK